MATFDSHWDFQNPEATRATFRELLQSMPAESDGYLELQTQIARTHSLVREFDQAHAVLDDVESRLSAETPVARIRYLLERGRAFRSSGDKPTAQPLFVRALEQAQQLGEDNYAVDAAHMIALTVPPDEQLEWNLRALSLAEASEDPRARRWLGSLYNNIGWTYHDAGNFSEALTVHQRGLEWQRQNGSRNTRLIAQYAVGRVLRSLGRVADAFAIQRAVLAEREEHQMPTGYVHEELGELFLAEENSAEAAAHFAQAYAQLSQDQWLKHNEPDRLNRLKALSNPA